MGHVFAGLAELELGRHEVAKQHYKNAITTQPNESLAWKVIDVTTIYSKIFFDKA